MHVEECIGACRTIPAPERGRCAWHDPATSRRGYEIVDRWAVIALGEAYMFSSAAAWTTFAQPRKALAKETGREAT